MAKDQSKERDNLVAEPSEDDKDEAQPSTWLKEKAFTTIVSPLSLSEEIDEEWVI